MNIAVTVSLIGRMDRFINISDFTNDDRNHYSSPPNEDRKPTDVAVWARCIPDNGRLPRGELVRPTATLTGPASPRSFPPPSSAPGSGGSSRRERLPCVRRRRPAAPRAVSRSHRTAQHRHRAQGGTQGRVRRGGTRPLCTPVTYITPGAVAAAAEPCRGAYRHSGAAGRQRNGA